MSYSDFFLNSSSSVVQLELLEIAHPNFSKTYRIVRNAINGVTVTLEVIPGEDPVVATFDYYPVRITPTGSSNDLDQNLQVIFGDLGQILPTELDLVLAKRGLVNGSFDASAANPPDAWTVYHTGAAPTLSYVLGYHSIRAIQIVSSTIYTGLVQTIDPYPIIGGTYSAACFAKSTPNTCVFFIRFLDSGGLLISQVGADTDTSNVFKRIAATGVCPAGTASVQLMIVTEGATTTTCAFDTISVSIPNRPIVKPTMIYRTYRSDDLTAPLSGPVRFNVNNITFQKDGATLQCSAPRLNLNSTGELYTMDRFPMLRGFI